MDTGIVLQCLRQKSIFWFQKPDIVAWWSEAYVTTEY